MRTNKQIIISKYEMSIKTFNHFFELYKIESNPEYKKDYEQKMKYEVKIMEKLEKQFDQIEFMNGNIKPRHL
jgi:hypothetical protein